MKERQKEHEVSWIGRSWIGRLRGFGKRWGKETNIKIYYMKKSFNQKGILIL